MTFEPFEAKEKALPLELTETLASWKLNAAAPISSLPDECLAAVFEAGARAQIIDDVNKHRLSFSMAVSQTTSRWRAVAIDTARLWTCVDVHIFEPTPLFDLVLKRSKLCSVDICIHDRTPSSDELTVLEDSRMESLVNQIWSLISRIRRLSIRSNRPCVPEFFIAYIQEAYMPILEHFSVEMGKSASVIENSQGWDAAKQNTIFLGGAPSLTSVNVSGISVRICWPPVSAVTTLKLSGDSAAYLPITYRRFVQILESLQSLIHLSLLGRVFVVESSDHAIPVDMISLLSLSVKPWNYHEVPNEDTETMYTSRLFETIIAPGLDSLEFDASNSNQINAFLVAFQNHGGSPKYPALRSLLLNPRCQATVPSKSFLAEFTTLQHLVCISREYGEAVLDGLISQDQPKEHNMALLCPHLRSVTFRVSYSDKSVILLSKLQAFCASRVMAKRPLRTVTLSLTPDDYALFGAQAFNPLRQYGLKVEFE